MKIKKIGLETAIILLLILMYFKFVPAWFSEWTNFDSFYAFGFFMLAFQIYFFHKNWDKIITLSKSPSMTAIPFLLVGVTLYTVGIRADYGYITNLSLPIFIAGIILFLYGTKTLRFILIPMILFTFSIPIFPLHRITMPLQVFSAATTSGILNFLGVNAHSEGSLLIVDNYRLSVAPGCSGLKSLSTLFFICLIYSYFMNISVFKKSVFVILSFPIAVSVNILRLIFVGFYALYNGYGGLVEFHDNVGLVGYFISIGIIFVIANFMQPKEDIYEK